MIIIPKLGFYLNKNTGEVFIVDKVTAGQNEITGSSKGVTVISDYNTSDEYEYLGVNHIELTMRKYKG